MYKQPQHSQWIIKRNRKNGTAEIVKWSDHSHICNVNEIYADLIAAAPETAEERDTLKEQLRFILQAVSIELNYLNTETSIKTNSRGDYIDVSPQVLQLVNNALAQLNKE